MAVFALQQKSGAAALTPEVSWALGAQAGLDRGLLRPAQGLHPPPARTQEHCHVVTAAFLWIRLWMDHQLALDQPLHETGHQPQKAICVQLCDIDEMSRGRQQWRSLPLGGLLLTPWFSVGGSPRADQAVSEDICGGHTWGVLASGGWGQGCSSAPTVPGTACRERPGRPTVLGTERESLL